jgi:hypothetical protein
MVVNAGIFQHQIKQAINLSVCVFSNTLDIYIEKYQRDRTPSVRVNIGCVLLLKFTEALQLSLQGSSVVATERVASVTYLSTTITNGVTRPPGPRRMPIDAFLSVLAINPVMQTFRQITVGLKLPQNLLN